MDLILDTNAVSALFLGDEALARVLGHPERHHLPVVVIGEYRYGVLGSDHRQHLENLLQIFIEQSIILSVDFDTAKIYSEVRHDLRRRGRPIPENDVWIAALARQHRQPVVTRDHHFDQVSGLQRVSW